MKAFSLLVVALVSTALVQATPSGVKETPDSKEVVRYCRVYSQPYSSGYYLDVTGYIPNLAVSGIDDDIESVSQSGMWMYYEHINYNAVAAGRVYFIHGIELAYTFPTNYANMATSIRYAGNYDRPNADTWTVYQGQYFTGNEFFGATDSPSLSALDHDVSSLILTGLSPWTLYSGQSWTGDSLCIYPDTDHDVGPQGDVLDFGIYPDITTLGIPDNSVRSVRKGCWANKIAKAEPMKMQGRAKNGAWGYVDL